MLQFWCLFPLRVAYHGPFRENLESAFWGFGVSYHNLIRQMQVFKKGTSGVLQFWCLSPVIVAYHGLFRENLESSFRGLGLSYVISQLDETHASLQNGAFEMLQFWCLSRVRVAYHGSFRENLGSAFWGFALSYHNLTRQMQVFKTEQLKCCSFDASSHSKWLIMAHLERIWSQLFGALECHITTWLGRCGSSKRSI